MTAVHARRRQAPDVEVLEFSPAQYRKVKEAALRSVGLTYKELAEQARRREFSSPRAQKVWITIGEQPD